MKVSVFRGNWRERSWSAPLLVSLGSSFRSYVVSTDPPTAAGSQELLSPTAWPFVAAVGSGFLVINESQPTHFQDQNPFDVTVTSHHSTLAAAPQRGHLAADSLISTHLSGLYCRLGCSIALFTSFSWVFSIFNGNLESWVMLAFLHFV